MRRLIIILAMIAMGAGYALAEEQTIPKIKQDCKTCHVSHAMVGNILLNAPLSELCLGCHADRKSINDHIVDIVPIMPVSNLPLDSAGRMTCITCHDPHGKTGFPRMLRARPGEICRYCHKM